MNFGIDMARGRVPPNGSGITSEINVDGGAIGVEGVDLAPYTGHVSEERRLALLARYDVLNFDLEPELEQVVDMLVSYFCVPMAAINFMDGRYLWFKARRGVPFDKVRRVNTFSCKTIRHASLFVVEDALEDPSWRDNSFVAGAPHVRFYAGAPVMVSTPPPIGTIAIADAVPRSFSGSDLLFLRAMARRVGNVLEERLRRRGTI